MVDGKKREFWEIIFIYVYGHSNINVIFCSTHVYLLK